MKIVVTVKIWVKINLLLSFFLWSQQSVSAIPLFPQSSPTTTTPNGSVGITDSLQTAQQLYEKKEYKKALKLIFIRDYINRQAPLFLLIFLKTREKTP